MFQKVLVVDDIDVVNIGVQRALESLEISSVVYSAYCDDAHLKIKKALFDGQPFDLLICDLSFEQDHRDRRITSGQSLITVLQKEAPELKMIAFSVEDHPQTIIDLWETNKVDGYVCKDRQGIKELIKAVHAVAEGERYLPQRLTMLIKQQNTLVLSNYDENVLALLSKGLTQHEIEARFKTEGISPSSKSTIEKRLKELRDAFEAQTNVHLITILKDHKLL